MLNFILTCGILLFILFFYQTVHEGRIYQLKLFCGKDYPDNPPSVRFQTRINMTCVNQESGMVGNFFIKDSLHHSNWIWTDKFLNYQVEPHLFPMLSNWKRESTMEDILLQLKKEMMSPQNRKLAQPPEGVSILFLMVTIC